MNFNNSVIDWKQVDNVISSSNRILLTTHENPDGDGLGSEVAMYHHLCDEKKDVKIIPLTASTFRPERSERKSIVPAAMPPEIKAPKAKGIPIAYAIATPGTTE